MHHHLEVILPNANNLQGDLEEILKQFSAHSNEDGVCNTHAFWDYWVIGGRYSGDKGLKKYPQDKLQLFYDWLNEQKVTVSGVQFGKQELSPASQIPLVDAKWSEMFPDFKGSCPLFKHSNDQSESEPQLPGDVFKVTELTESMCAFRVIIAHAGWDSKKKTHSWDHKPKAGFMRTRKFWNGCNHEKTSWDEKILSVIKEHNEWIKERFNEKYANQNFVRDDWVVVTVDYHNQRKIQREIC